VRERRPSANGKPAFDSSRRELKFGGSHEVPSLLQLVSPKSGSNSGKEREDVCWRKEAREAQKSATKVSEYEKKRSVDRGSRGTVRRRD